MATCLDLTDKKLMGIWQITNHPLITRIFNNKKYLTQQTATGSNVDTFIVRAGEMLSRSDVALYDPSYPSLVSCYDYPYSNYGGLETPNELEFPTPLGYIKNISQDGTVYYELENTIVIPNYNYNLKYDDIGYSFQNFILSVDTGSIYPINVSRQQLIDGLDISITGNAKKIFVTSEQSVCNINQDIIPLTESDIEPFPTGSNNQFENVTLKSIIKGTNDIPNNYYGINDFPLTKIQTDDYYPLLIQGSGAEYLDINAKAVISRSLATGFGNLRLFDTNTDFTTIKSEDRSLWRAYHPTNVSDYRSLGIAEANILFDQHCAIPNPNDPNQKIPRYIKYFLSDTEGYPWYIDGVLPSYIDGFYTQAKSRYPNFVYFMYGVALTKHFPSYNYQGDERFIFPDMNPDLIPYYYISSGVISGSSANQNIIYDCGTYFKTIMPLSSSIYQKDENGNFLLDNNNNRIYRNTSFTEITRTGKTYTWGLPDPNASPDSASGENYKRKVPEWHLAIWQPYLIYARMVTAMQMIMLKQGNTDISNFHSLSPYKIGWANRLTAEANTWNGEEQSLDTYSSGISHLLALVLTKNDWLWDSYNGVDGFDQNSSALEGQKLLIKNSNDVYERNDWHNGNLRQSWAVNNQLQIWNRNLGLNKKTDKLLLFTDYLNLNSTKELLGFGTLSDNKIQIILTYPLLEIDENVTVEIGNTKTNQIFYTTINGRKDIKFEAYSFVGINNLEPKDIYIKYNTIKNKNVKLSGNLNYHLLSSDETTVNNNFITLYENGNSYVKYKQLPSIFEKIENYDRDNSRRLSPITLNTWSISNKNPNKKVYSSMNIKNSSGEIIYKYDDNLGAIHSSFAQTFEENFRANNHQISLSNFLIKEGNYVLEYTNKSNSQGTAELILWDQRPINDFYILIGKDGVSSTQIYKEIDNLGILVQPGETVTKQFSIIYENTDNKLYKTNSNSNTL